MIQRNVSPIVSQGLYQTTRATRQDTQHYLFKYLKFRNEKKTRSYNY